MKKLLLTSFLFLITVNLNSQKSKKIIELESKKKKFEIELRNLKDSINEINLRIAILNSERLFNKIKDSSLTATTSKGAYLLEKADITSNVIKKFNTVKKIIILNYIKDDVFEVCQDSICGYMHKVWINNNTSRIDLNELINAKKKINFYNTRSNISPLKSRHSSKSSYKTKYFSKKYRTYYLGVKGGCYYVNSNGNKTYVSRNLCN